MSLSRSSVNMRSASASRLTMPALVLAVIAISFASIFFRFAAPTHPLIAASVRLAFSALLLFPFVWRARKRNKLDRRTILSGIAAGACYGLHFGAWVSSLSMTTIAASVTLVTTTPILLGIVSLFSGNRHPPAKFWYSIFFALIGLTLIGKGDLSLDSKALVGDGLALLGAIGMAGYMTIVHRAGVRIDLLAFSGIATAVGAFLLLFVALFAEIPLEVASMEAWLFLLLAALVPQIIGHNLLTWSLRSLPPTAVSMVVVAEPVGATALGWIWLGEVVGFEVALGCAITLIAVLIAVWKKGI